MEATPSVRSIPPVRSSGSGTHPHFPRTSLIPSGAGEQVRATYLREGISTKLIKGAKLVRAIFAFWRGDFGAERISEVSRTFR